MLGRGGGPFLPRPYWHKMGVKCDAVLLPQPYSRLFAGIWSWRSSSPLSSVDMGRVGQGVEVVGSWRLVVNSRPLHYLIKFSSDWRWRLFYCRTPMSPHLWEKQSSTTCSYKQGIETCVLFGPSYTTPAGESDCCHLLLPAEAWKISSLFCPADNTQLGSPTFFCRAGNRVLVSCLPSSADITGWENWSPAACFCKIGEWDSGQLPT